MSPQQHNPTIQQDLELNRGTCRLLDVESSESKLYLIFEFCDSDLKKYMNNIRGTLSAHLVKVSIRGICRTHSSLTRLERSFGPFG